MYTHEYHTRFIVCFFLRLDWARGAEDEGRCGSLGCGAVGVDLNWESLGGATMRSAPAGLFADSPICK